MSRLAHPLGCARRSTASGSATTKGKLFRTLNDQNARVAEPVVHVSFMGRSCLCSWRSVRCPTEAHNYTHHHGRDRHARTETTAGTAPHRNQGSRENTRRTAPCRWTA